MHGSGKIKKPNGYCWQESGVVCEHCGTCRGCKRYWGHSGKSLRCTCGEFVSLT